MGLLGCLTARELDRLGAHFTWSDPEAKHTAWKASTGAVYPSALEEDYRGWWMAQEGLPTELGAWAHDRKAHPFGHKGTSCAFGSLILVDAPSVHVNVQALVLAQRRHHRARHVEEAPAGSSVWVTNGFAGQATHYQWGWSARLRAAHLGGPRRQALVVQRNRFETAYLYPVAGEDFYWAGSAKVTQATPAQRPTGGYEAKWRAIMAERCPELQAGPFLEVFQGWRPIWDRPFELQRFGSGLMFPAAGSNGVRLFPALVEDIERWAKRFG